MKELTTKERIENLFEHMNTGPFPIPQANYNAAMLAALAKLRIAEELKRIADSYERR